MKQLFFAITFLIIGISSFCQRDSIIEARTGQDLRDLETVILINGFLFDSTTTIHIMNSYRNQIEKRIFYTREEGYKKWGLISRDGVMLIRMKKEFFFRLKTSTISQ